jgi:hypothetical protein
MKKLLLASVLSLSIAGCANWAAFLNDLTSGQAAQIIDDVQVAVQAACGVEPTAVSIIGLWNATWGATVGVIAGEICQAVGQPPVAARFHAGSNSRLIWTPKHPVVINGQVVNFD